ncbi:MAG: 6-phosphogluconolactonase [Verrucomicrobia bacterium]|nr:6-phosphogluconolactonase [Verrucomicrobiota bacterium]
MNLEGSSHLTGTSPRNVELHHFPDEQQLCEAAAERWIQSLPTSDAAAYALALSGGRIAGRLLRSIASLSRNQRNLLDRVHFFWADERCVPPAHAESNFGVANRELLLPLDVRPHQIHRIRGEIDDRRAASEAEQDMRRIVPTRQDGQPVLDMVFLGMGEDGHVASLFPEEPEEPVGSRTIYRSVVATKPPPVRITLTYGTIVRAKQVWIVASGPNKMRALKESLTLDGKTPLARVLQRRRHSVIYTDIPVPDA